MLIAQNFAATKFRHLLRLRCEWGHRNKSSFCFCVNQECTDFPKSRNHVKVLGARKVMRSKCLTKDKYRIHRINISRPDDLALRVCALLVSMACLHCFMNTTFVYSFAENITY